MGIEPGTIWIPNLRARSPRHKNKSWDKHVGRKKNS